MPTTEPSEQSENVPAEPTAPPSRAPGRGTPPQGPRPLPNTLRSRKGELLFCFNVWLPKELIDDFKAHFPKRGARSEVVRQAFRRLLGRAEPVPPLIRRVGQSSTKEPPERAKDWLMPRMPGSAPRRSANARSRLKS